MIKIGNVLSSFAIAQDLPGSPVLLLTSGMNPMGNELKDGRPGHQFCQRFVHNVTVFSRTRAAMPGRVWQPLSMLACYWRRSSPREPILAQFVESESSQTVAP